MQVERNNLSGATVITLLPDQISSQEPLTLRLHANSCFTKQAKMASILEQIGSSPLFSNEETRLNEWSSRLLQLDFTAEEGETKETNARLICSFLFEVIHSKMDEERNVENERKLFTFDDQIRNLLKNILPDNVEVDLFIENYEKNLDDESFEKERSEAINVFNQETNKLSEYCALVDLYSTARRNMDAIAERLYSNPRTNLEAILEQMNHSQLFSPLKMNEWESKLRSLVFDTEERSIQEDNGLVICLFLFDMIRPALKDEQSAEKRQKLLAFEIKIKRVLKNTLPHDAEVDNFIKKFEGYLDLEMVSRQKFYMIRACFKEQTKQLIDSADQVNQDLKQKCEILKKRLQEVTEMRKLMSEELFKEFDALTEKVTQLLQQLNTNEEKLRSTGECMQSEQDDYFIILQNCEDILKKCDL